LGNAYRISARKSYGKTLFGRPVNNGRIIRIVIDIREIDCEDSGWMEQKI
jgi:hypothetical protein